MTEKIEAFTKIARRHSPENATLEEMENPFRSGPFDNVCMRNLIWTSWSRRVGVRSYPTGTARPLSFNYGLCLCFLWDLLLLPLYLLLMSVTIPIWNPQLPDGGLSYAGRGERGDIRPLPTADARVPLFFVAHSSLPLWDHP